MKILRIFPRRTNATPDDMDVRINTYPTFFDEADEIHISVTFTWDIPKAELLYNQWKYVAPTKIGGVAYGTPQGEFTPGMYIKKGYTITSRGCPNRCWFCSVWKRNPVVKELQIHEGNNLLDDNILACSDQHINNVFEMLKKQKQVEFTGGLEAKLITESIAVKLYNLKPKQIFCAYDTPDDLPYLINAGELLQEAGFKNHILRAYVLIGYKNDTIYKATRRMIETIKAGFMPMAMLWRDEKGEYDLNWKRFQRQWANPTIIASNMKKILLK